MKICFYHVIWFYVTIDIWTFWAKMHFYHVIWFYVTIDIWTFWAKMHFYHVIWFYVTIDIWTFLAKMHFLDILDIVSLNVGQISSNLLKKVFTIEQHAFRFTYFFALILGHLLRHVQKSKFCDICLRKWPISTSFWALGFCN